MFLRKNMKKCIPFTFLLVTFGVIIGIRTKANLRGDTRAEVDHGSMSIWQTNTNDSIDMQTQNRSTINVFKEKTVNIKPDVTETSPPSKSSHTPKVLQNGQTFSEKTLKAFHKSAVDLFTIKEDSRRTSMVNRHKYVYIIDSNLCLEKHIPIMVLVHSAAQYGNKRKLIRDTWASVTLGRYTPVVVFMLGQSFPYNVSLQKTIELESKTYGDIVQGEFIDTYYNMTLKHVMAIHWVTSHCDDVRTIVKLDDDVFVDVYKLGNFSVKVGYIQNSLYCHELGVSRPQRMGKWAAPKELYPFPVYPSYCEGMAYIMSMKVARKLVRASEMMGFFWIDDVYVTGLLRCKAGVSLTNLSVGHNTLKMDWITGLDVRNMNFKANMFFVEFNATYWNYLMLKMLA